MTTLKAQEKYIIVNGVRLRYLDWGTAGKPPLICLHGHTGQAHIWDEFAESISPDYHVLAVDQRGHGESQWAGTGYERESFVEDLAAFVDALGLARFDLVGLSMGGWNSLLYALDHPERVNRIVLVDIAPELNPEFIAQMKHRPPTPMEFPSLDTAVEWMRQGNSWATDGRLRRDAEDKIRRQDDGQWTWNADPALFNTPLRDFTDPGLIGRYWKAIEVIPCPILEVRGAESKMVHDEVIQRMETVGRRFSSVDVIGAGHVVTIDKPQEFIQATRPFLGVPD